MRFPRNLFRGAAAAAQCARGEAAAAYHRTAHAPRGVAVAATTVHSTSMVGGPCYGKVTWGLWNRVQGTVLRDGAHCSQSEILSSSLSF